MGMSADAEIVWGIPVLRYDEEWDDGTESYKLTRFWDEESEWWREFDAELEIHMWGHIEDPDNTRGILTSTRMERFSADCWDPTELPFSLPSPLFNDKAYSKANDVARSYDLGVDFYSEARWWLVCSYG